MGEAALRYVEELDFPVFPLGPKCRPGMLEWEGTSSGFLAVYDATKDPKLVAEYWRRYPDANIGLATGLSAGVLVVDVDRHPGQADGFESIARLEAEHNADFPITASVDTPGNGRHFYFQTPPYPVVNRVGIVPGVDIRHSGSAVPLPPSHKPNGPYRGVIDRRMMQPIPDWLMAIIAPPPTPPPPRAPMRFVSSLRTARYLQKAIDEEYARVAHAGPGTRNMSLFIAAASLGSLVGAGLLPELYVGQTLMEAASANGLVRDDGARECRATILSGLKTGRSKPREVDLG